MKVSVKVPATSANVGPGFDCLGLALPIYNTITIEETVLPGTGIEINMMSEEESIDEMVFDSIPRDENNIVYGEGWNIPMKLPKELGGLCENFWQLPGFSFFNDSFRNLLKSNFPSSRYFFNQIMGLLIFIIYSYFLSISI